MNKIRRAKLVKLAADLDVLLTELEALKEEEQGAFDNMPESLQQGERGTASEEAINAMESAAESLSEAVAALEEASV